MTPDHTTFDLADLDGRDRYKLLIGLVVPRPIGWVGTLSPGGVPNLAPYSFFNVVAGTPPTVLFSAGRSRRDKDSYANARDTGEFTLSVVTEELAEAMVATSGEYGPDVDEFAVAGLTAAPGTVVDAPFVAEAKAVMECRVSRIVELGPAPANVVVFGDVLRVHAEEALLDGTRVDPKALKAIGRMAGSGYATTADGYFEMERPVV
ncbi:MAG: flavin reductase family protein [Acidimicrobiia bacterium]|nr:flavin reductase family protein [Acidimicrobiia bacterium]